MSKSLEESNPISFWLTELQKHANVSLVRCPAFRLHRFIEQIFYCYMLSHILTLSTYIYILSALLQRRTIPYILSHPLYNVYKQDVYWLLTKFRKWLKKLQKAAKLPPASPPDGCLYLRGPCLLPSLSSSPLKTAGTLTLASWRLPRQTPKTTTSSS